MASTTASQALQRFVDDEILRTPLLVGQTIDGTLDHLRKSMPAMLPHERAIAGDLSQSLLSNRQHVIDYYTASLREQVEAETGRRAPPATERPAPRKTLSLVDEDEVSVDVEISHTIEAIRSIADHELRELQTFVSALVGDMEVARDHNPFRADSHARALWAASQALPLTRGFRVAFMRHAGGALAQALRKTYAGASSRLEAAGVEPASYRTLILPAGARRTRPSEVTFNPDLQRILDSMPVRAVSAGRPRPPLEQVLALADAQLRALPAEAGAAARARLQEQQRSAWLDSAVDDSQQQCVELLTRLFDAILDDRELTTDVQLLLARLRAPALRRALADPKTLDDENDPLWRFMDRIAFLGDTLPEPGDAARARSLRFVLGVLDHVLGEPEPTAALYSWAIERLNKHEQHRFEQRCAAAADEIASLQALEDKLLAAQGPLTTMHGALDIAQLDTVPAELIDHDAAPPAVSAADWLQARHPADWVRIFMQGRWIHGQILWPGERGELWLVVDGAGDTTWAVRRRALLTLHAENLLGSLLPRSLMRDAARRLLRRLTP